MNSEPSLVPPIHTLVPCSLLRKSQTIVPCFQTSVPPWLFQAKQTVSQGSLGTWPSWEVEESCAVILARKPIVPCTFKQTPDGERSFRNRAPVCVSNLSQELPKEVVSVLALLTPHSVLALPLILLAEWSGGEVEKPGCTSSLSVSCAVCSSAVAQAGQS